MESKSDVSERGYFSKDKFRNLRTSCFLTERFLTLSCQRDRRDNPDLFTQLVDLRFIGLRLGSLFCDKRTFSPPEFCDATGHGQSTWRRRSRACYVVS
jgi:hypothetical protein